MSQCAQCTLLKKRISELEKEVSQLRQKSHMPNEAGETLAYQAAFERLATNISTRFINIDPKMIDREIENTLKMIGEFAGVDRCYVFEFYRNGEMWRNTHEWCAPGIKPQIGLLKELKVADYPWQAQRLKRFETIYIPDVGSLHEEAAAEKRLFEMQDIKSCVMVPMITRGALLGLLGFDSVRSRKVWSQHAISLLNIVGEIFVNALERKRIEEALERSEEKTRRIIERLKDDYFFYRHNAEGIFTDVSSSVVNVLGYSREEFLTEYTRYLTENPINKEVVRRTLASLKGVLQEPYELEAVRKDGQKVVLEVQEILVTYEEGRAVAIEGLAHDISKRKKMEETLRIAKDELEKRVRARTAEIRDANLQLRNKIEEYQWAEQMITQLLQEQQILLDTVPALIFFMSSDYRMIRVNKAFAELFGKTKEELEGESYFSIGLDENDAQAFAKEDEEILRTGRPKRRILRKFTIHNQPKWVLTDKIPYTDKTGKTIGVIGFSLDVSDYQIAQEVILSLSQKLIKAQEIERQRISRYLHDNVAQNLSTVRMDCEALCKDLSVQHPVLEGKVSEMSEILQLTIAEVRNLSYDLRPPGLEQMGLARTIYRLCEDFQKRSGIAVDFYSAGMDNLELDFDTEINLYRIVQEALNNIKKHAEADLVVVRLVASYPNILLRIEDNGKGFDVPDHYDILLNKKSMGLQSMHERVRLIRGKLKIQSKLKKGTKILVESPPRPEGKRYER